MTSPTLSPLQCAAQFDLLAQSHYDAAREHMARYDRLHDDSTPEGHIARADRLDKVPVEQEACRQLRFAATFLREHAVSPRDTLRWSDALPLPTVPGVYWMRDLSSPNRRPAIWRLYRMDDGRWWVQLVDGRPPDQVNGDIADIVKGCEWAGPLPEPMEESTP